MAGGRVRRGAGQSVQVSAIQSWLLLVIVLAGLVVATSGAATTGVMAANISESTTTRVSLSSAGVQANAASFKPSVSADGRYIAFVSFASNLVVDDTQKCLDYDGHSYSCMDVYVYDRQTLQVSLVSKDSTGKQANKDSGEPTISSDGRYVAFQSLADNLVSGDTNNANDVFVHDRQTGQTTRVSVSSTGQQGNAHSGSPAISANGRYVAFDSSASNLVNGDTNEALDVFVHDRVTGQTTRVSVDSMGNQSGAGGGSVDPSISATGRFVAFASGANDLVSDDTNENSDIFVHDLETGETTRVNLTSDGTQSNGGAIWPVISADGNAVAFRSWASDLVPNDTNDSVDVFIRDRQAGETSRVSVTSSGSQSEGEDDGIPWDYYSIAISGNGQCVSFVSGAKDLVSDDTNQVRDVFLHNIATAETSRVSVSSTGSQANGMSSAPSIANDCQAIAFYSDARNLVPGDTNKAADVFVHLLSLGSAPIANDDNYSTDEDKALNIGAPGLLTNDTDADGDALTALLVNTSSHGTLSLKPDGSFTYVPQANFNGTDSFTYHANDGVYLSKAATVSITIKPVGDRPVANDLTITTNEDQPVAFTLPASDADGDALTFEFTDTLKHGTLTGTAPNLTYTPAADYGGVDSFMYRASDGSINSAWKTVKIVISAVDDQAPPVAINDSYSIGLDATLSVTGPGLLSNDTAQNGDQRIYFFGENRHVNEFAWYSNTWHHNDVTVDLAKLPAANSPLVSVEINGSPRVYFLTADGHVQELAWLAIGWNHLDITAITAGTPAHSQSSLIAAVENGQPRVYYLDPNLHIHELAWHPGGWHDTDVMQGQPWPLPSPGSPLAVTTAVNMEPYLFYVGSDSHVHLLVQYGGQWRHRDLMTAVPKAPLAIANGKLSATTVNGQPRVYYETHPSALAGYHINQLAWVEGQWQFLNLAPYGGFDTEPTGALATTALNYAPRVFFNRAPFGNGREVMELAEIDGQWQPSYLSDLTSASLSAIKSPLAALSLKFWSNVYYFGNDRHLNALFWLVNRWHHDDLTAMLANPPLAATNSPISATTASDGTLKVVRVTDVSNGQLSLTQDGSFTYKPKSGFCGEDSFTYKTFDGLSYSKPATVRIQVCKDNPIAQLGTGPVLRRAPSDTFFVNPTEYPNRLKYVYQNQGPIKFDIMIDRVLGRTDDKGYLLDADNLINNGIIPAKVTLHIAAYDVDNGYSHADAMAEEDLVTVNGYPVGQLIGSDGQWSITEFEIDVHMIRFGIPTCRESEGGALPAYLSDCSSAPVPARNEISISVDSANPTAMWAVGIDTAWIDFEAARPILFVHGRGGSDDGEDPCSAAGRGDGCAYWDHIDNVYYFGFRQMLTQEGFLTAITENYLGGETSIAENARRMDYIVPWLLRRYGVDKINIVAHSKGGLDSRLFIVNARHTVVERLVTLATPHHGSYMGDLGKDTPDLILKLLDRRNSPAMNNLSEEYVNGTFNYMAHAQVGVKYYSIFAQSGDTCRNLFSSYDCASRLQLDALPPEKAKGAAAAFQILDKNGEYKGNNDFLVTKHSARLLGGGVYGHNSMNSAEYGPYFLNHHSIRAALLSKGVSDPTIVNLVSDILDIRPDTAARTAERIDLEPEKPVDDDDGAGLGVESGTISEGSTIVQPVGLDTVSTSGFFLVWQTGDLSLNLIDPSGATITPTTPGNHITYSEDRVGGPLEAFLVDAKWIYYEIAGAQKGLWQAQVVAADQLPGGEANWILMTSMDSDIALDLWTESSWAPLNGTVRMTAEVKLGSVSIADAKVVGTVIFPDETIRTIELYDDGVHGDGSAGDGLYSNTFRGTQFGIYGLSAKATGVANGIPFSRMDVTEVQVASGTATVSGAFSDQGVDSNGDGLYDFIRINIPVNVTTPGKYMVFGELQSETGTSMSWASVSSELVSGQRTMSLDFDAEEVWRNGGSGRFHLVNLTLMDMTTAELPVQIDFKAAPYTTTKYGADNFQHPAIYLTGETQDYGVDANGNGLYDELVVEVEVLLDLGGEYQWEARLVDGDGVELGACGEASNLPVGMNTLACRFDGNAIGASGRSGTLYLVDLDVWGDGGLVSTPEAARTAAYSYRQFESAPPGMDLYLPALFR